MHFTPVRMARIKTKTQVTTPSGKDLEQGDSPPYLAGVSTFTATVEVNVVLSPKTGN